jgi:hypothetical protein
MGVSDDGVEIHWPHSRYDQEGLPTIAAWLECRVIIVFKRTLNTEAPPQQEG